MDASASFLVEQDGSTLIVTPCRNLSSFVQPDLHVEISGVLRRIDAPDIRGVVLDLGAIHYFDSTMLDLVVVIRKALRQKEGKLVVCGASAMGREVFRVTRLDTHFVSALSRTEALELALA